MNPTIYFQSEAYSTKAPKLMGRNAAGESFLRGYLQHNSAEKLWALVSGSSEGQALAQTVQSFGDPRPVKTFTATELGLLAESSLLYFPGPNLGELAWQRSLFGHSSWSLCGITHTTASAGAMGGITDLLTAPVQPWDALICTSTAVQDNVQCLLEAQQEYLQQRLGAQQFVLPQLPVIPLGIHTGDFTYTPNQREAARQQLGVEINTLVVLFAGRLSFHAKAHPLAMYQALEQAAQQTAQPVVLIECGWHANEHIQRAFADAVQQYCPSVRWLSLDSRNEANRQAAWASADLFCSLSDNLQESFGLTPVEAMATGLPVVVSDWDGYRDTVRDGVDGFCIPTLMPEAGMAEDLAQRHALGIDTYDMYCGHTCSLVAVDVEATTQAFVELFQSAELRQQMGEAGRKRAREVYDWSVIIPRYETLWVELAEIRRQEGPTLPVLRHPWPARLEPFHAYASYPTRTLSGQTRLELIDADPITAWQRVQRFQQLAMVNFANYVIPSEEEIRTVLEGLATGPQEAGQLVEGIPLERQVFVLRGLAWLVKLGVLRVIQ